MFVLDMFLDMTMRHVTHMFLDMTMNFETCYLTIWCRSCCSGWHVCTWHGHVAVSCRILSHHQASILNSCKSVDPNVLQRKDRGKFFKQIFKLTCCCSNLRPLMYLQTFNFTFFPVSFSISTASCKKINKIKSIFLILRDAKKNSSECILWNKKFSLHDEKYYHSFIITIKAKLWTIK